MLDRLPLSYDELADLADTLVEGAVLIGTDNFIYEIADDKGATARAQVTITVVPPPPTVTPSPTTTIILK